MKLDHTPGPWVVDHEMWVYSTSNVPVAVCEAINYNKKQGRSDAQLIAAAPEMIEALIALVQDSIKLGDSCDAGCYDAKDCEPVKSTIPLIEKATGKTWEELNEDSA
jgi:hypothetical protein